MVRRLLILASFVGLMWFVIWPFFRSFPMVQEILHSSLAIKGGEPVGMVAIGLMKLSGSPARARSDLTKLYHRALKEKFDVSRGSQEALSRNAFLSRARDAVTRYDFPTIDKDGDGFITREEWGARDTYEFYVLDEGKDDSISEREYWVRKVATIRDQFDEIDRDKNGMINFDDYVKLHADTEGEESFINSIDVDSNGVISDIEITAANVRYDKL